MEKCHLGFGRKEFFHRLPDITTGIDLFHDGFLFYPGYIPDRLIEEVGADPQFILAPVRKDPAHDKPDKDRQLIGRKAGELAADQVDHLKPS